MQLFLLITAGLSLHLFFVCQSAVNLAESNLICQGIGSGNPSEGNQRSEAQPLLELASIQC